jgi:hypothetical protein
LVPDYAEMNAKHILMKPNTVVIARAFCKKVGIDRLKIVATQGAFYNV